MHSVDPRESESAERGEGAPTTIGAPGTRTAESPLIARVAFGSVVGAVVGLLLDPLLSLLPPADLLSEFVEGLVSAALNLAVIVAFGIFAARVQRLDRFLRRYLVRIALAVSLFLPLALWINAGAPTGLAVLLSLVVTGFVTATFLIVCGEIVYQTMQAPTEAQAKELAERRAAEAERIAEGAIAAGDPQIAAGVFGADLAGRVGRMQALACVGVVGAAVLGPGIVIAGTAGARFLYELAWQWSFLVGCILLAAAIRVVTFGSDLGTAHAHQVPTAEKHQPILPERPN
jgi:hypothetical protein